MAAARRGRSDGVARVRRPRVSTGGGDGVAGQQRGHNSRNRRVRRGSIAASAADRRGGVEVAWRAGEQGCSGGSLLGGDVQPESTAARGTASRPRVAKQSMSFYRCLIACVGKKGTAYESFTGFLVSALAQGCGVLQTDSGSVGAGHSRIAVVMSFGILRFCLRLPFT